jgi:hypothetical protein
VSRATIRDPLAGANKLERDYAQALSILQRAGEIIHWSYESIKLRLADGAFYTPDFMVVTANGDLEIHETKGFMREAARVRLKVAAELHPFRFRLVRRGKSGWELGDV